MKLTWKLISKTILDPFLYGSFNVGWDQDYQNQNPILDR